jgi:NhaP-type Na+/H+ or K+/H+ antiporter
MAQLTPLGLVKIMGLVTVIMVIPMVGGAVVGLVLDGALGTSPLLVLTGLAVGTLIAAIGIWLLIRAGARRGYTDGRPGDRTLTRRG